MDSSGWILLALTCSNTQAKIWIRVAPKSLKEESESWAEKAISQPSQVIFEDNSMCSDRPLDPPTPDAPPQKYDFHEPIVSFWSKIDSLRTSIPAQISQLVQSQAAASRAVNSFLQTAAESMPSDDPDTVRYNLPLGMYPSFERLVRRVNRFRVACDVVPETCIIYLVCSYDALVGDLVRGVLRTLPQRLNNSEKNISLSQLMRLGSIDAAREFLIEKEVESVLRESHADQVAWFESNLDIPLRKDLAIWPAFIELTERRNLYVHTDGRVSSQYLTVCSNHHVIPDKGVTLGQKLPASLDYFYSASDTILQMGVKLGHVIWRKVLPEQIEMANTVLNNFVVELVDSEQYPLAIEFARFPFKLPKKPEVSATLLLKINEAQAYKWAGDESSCKDIVGQIDWTLLGDKFQLARAALEDRFVDAARLVRHIGPEGEVTESDYQVWPIFRRFRESEEFQSAFASVFGRQFSQLSLPAKSPVPLLESESPHTDEAERPSQEAVPPKD